MGIHCLFRKKNLNTSNVVPHLSKYTSMLTPVTPATRRLDFVRWDCPCPAGGPRGPSSSSSHLRPLHHSILIYSANRHEARSSWLMDPKSFPRLRLCLTTGLGSWGLLETPGDSGGQRRPICIPRILLSLSVNNKTAVFAKH